VELLEGGVAEDGHCAAKLDATEQRCLGPSLRGHQKVVKGDLEQRHAVVLLRCRGENLTRANESQGKINE
jgi:hypothetical protein